MFNLPVLTFRFANPNVLFALEIMEPGEVLRDGHLRIFRIICCLEHLIMKGVLGVQWLF